MTELQRRALARAIKAYPESIIATGSGDRVTLASLHTRGLLTRTVRREARQEADRAYAYKASDLVMEEWRAICARKAAP